VMSHRFCPSAKAHRMHLTFVTTSMISTCLHSATVRFGRSISLRACENLVWSRRVRSTVAKLTRSVRCLASVSRTLLRGTSSFPSSRCGTSLVN
jgi:hypothetical protein